jgi:hypothetical protein
MFSYYTSPPAIGGETERNTTMTNEYFEHAIYPAINFTMEKHSFCKTHPQGNHAIKKLL